ncbi:MAG: hypothetical protein LBG11_06650 [Bifidobacteriaceae bacterium]|nr:hypothetical protein [Bifidobacteriaceae bacterium]
MRIAGGLAACAVLGIAAALSSLVMLLDWPGATGLFGAHNDFSTEWLGAFLTGIASVLGFGAVARNCFGAPTCMAIILAPIGFALSDLVAMWLVTTLGWG